MNTPTPEFRTLSGDRVQLTLSTEDFERLMGSETTEWWVLKRRIEPALAVAEADSICKAALR